MSPAPTLSATRVPRHHNNTTTNKLPTRRPRHTLNHRNITRGQHGFPLPDRTAGAAPRAAAAAGAARRGATAAGCGDGGCGKSSITLRFVRSQWMSEYDPTIEDNCSVKRRIDGTTCHLSLTDTAGQEEYRGMWASSNLGADAFLLVYDITSRDSLDALQYFNDLIDMEAETRLDNAERTRKAGVQPGGEGGTGGGYTAPGSKVVPPVKIVAGNKCDLQQSKQVPAAVGLDWARRRGCGFMETSACLEVNIEETFALLVRRVMERRQLAQMGISDNTEMNARGMTKPLTPLPHEQGTKGSAASGETRGKGGPRMTGERFGRGQGGFWKRLRCW